MKNLFYAGCICCYAVIAGSCQRDNNGMELSKEINERRNVADADSRFMVEAAHDAMLEVELARYAQTHAVTQQVKDYAGGMIRDHSKTVEELRKLSGDKNISIPMEMDVVPDVKDITDDWDDERIEGFDKAYIRQMVKDHRRVVDKFEKASRNCVDTDIRTFASNSLVMLRQHLQDAQKLKEDIRDKDAAMAREREISRNLKNNRPGATRQQ